MALAKEYCLACMGEGEIVWYDSSYNKCSWCEGWGTPSKEPTEYERAVLRERRFLPVSKRVLRESVVNPGSAQKFHVSTPSIEVQNRLYERMTEAEWSWNGEPVEFSLKNRS